jgi:hypothetical protein
VSETPEVQEAVERAAARIRGDGGLDWRPLVRQVIADVGPALRAEWEREALHGEAACPNHGRPAQREDPDAQVRRLRHAAAAALERVEVGDCAEAELILSGVVKLDGSLVRSDELQSECELDLRARLTAKGWTVERASLYDEEGVEGWRWMGPGWPFSAEGRDELHEIGDWHDLPAIPDCLLDV